MSLNFSIDFSALHRVSIDEILALNTCIFPLQAGYNIGIDYNNLSSSANDTGSCITNRSDESYILREQVQAEAANWNMYQSLVEFLPGTIAPIIYGSLGDKIGRRMLFILPCIGSILSVSIYMIIIWFKLPIWVILFTSVERLFGGSNVLLTGAFSYISDTTSSKHRALRMTFIDAVSLANGAITSLFVGYWIRAQGFFWPLIFVIGGRLICLLYAIFLVPETLKKDESSTESNSIKWRDMVAAFKLSLQDDGTGRRWKINTLLFSHSVSELISTYDIATMYLMNVPLCWGPVTLGYYTFIRTMVMCISMLIMSGVPVRFITAEWKVVISKTSSVMGTVYMAIAVTSFMMYFGKQQGQTLSSATQYILWVS